MQHLPGGRLVDARVRQLDEPPRDGRTSRANAATGRRVRRHPGWRSDRQRVELAILESRSSVADRPVATLVRKAPIVAFGVEQARRGRTVCPRRDLPSAGRAIAPLSGARGHARPWPVASQTQLMGTQRGTDSTHGIQWKHGGHSRRIYRAHRHRVAASVALANFAGARPRLRCALRAHALP